MTLRANVHALTRDHLTNTPFGPAKAAPLIRQLEAAIKPNKSTSGGGASGRGEVINLSALALWEEIAADIGIHTIEAGLTPKPDRIESLRQWEMLDGDPDWADFLEHVTLDWCDRIAALLSPLKPWHPAQPCPACGMRFYGEESAPTLSVHYLGSDGQIAHPETWRMDCGGCGAEWEGDSLGAVSKAMSA